MEKVFMLVDMYVHNVEARKSVIKYFEVECGWHRDQLVDDERFEAMLKSYKDSHPGINLG